MLNWTFDPDTFSGHQIGFTRVLAENHPLLSSDELETWLQSIQKVADAEEYFFSLNRFIFSAVKPGLR